MRVLALVCALVLSACSFTFDGTAPDFPLVGSPPSNDSFPRYNRSLVDSFSIVLGRDNAYWLAMRPTTMRGMLDYYELVRIPPEVDETGSNQEQPELDQLVELTADRIYLYFTRFFMVNPDPLPEGFDTKEHTLLRIYSAGQNSLPTDLVMPPGPELLVVGLQESAFVYYPKAKTTESFAVMNRVGKVLRTLPVMEGVDPADPLKTDSADRDKGGLIFFAGGGLITRDGNGRFVKHALDKEEDIDLGVLPRQVIASDRDKSFYTCESGVVRRVPYDGSQQVVLDDQGCSSEGMFLNGDYLYYSRLQLFHRVRVDGSEAPEQILDPAAKRILMVAGPQQTVVYSREPSNMFINGAGDGWIGDWRFMERGRAPLFNLDYSRVRWLEYAARNGGIGDLMTADVPYGTPARLARNVAAYNHLADGRVVVASNHAFTGAHNRVILVDESEGQATWIADQAEDYSFVPGSTDIFVDVVAGPSGFDIRRLPLPRKPLP